MIFVTDEQWQRITDAIADAHVSFWEVENLLPSATKPLDVSNRDQAKAICDEMRERLLHVLDETERIELKKTG